MAFAWAMAMAVSILLRIAGHFHPTPLEIHPFLVWSLVFGPSLFFLVMFLIKRHVFSDRRINPEV